MAKNTVVARVRLRAHAQDIEIYFDDVFQILEADVAQSALATFGHGYTARFRAREGSLLIDIVISTASVLTLAGGTVLAVEKFLADYPKMKAGLSIFIEDTRKFGRMFRADFNSDTKSLPLQEESYEAEVIAPKQLLELIETIENLDQASVALVRNQLIERSHKLAAKLRSTLSGEDKSLLLEALEQTAVSDSKKFATLLLGAKADQSETKMREDQQKRLLLPKLEEAHVSRPRRRRLGRSKTIDL